MISELKRHAGPVLKCRDEGSSRISAGETLDLNARSALPLKRLFDLIFAIVVLIFISPLIALIVICLLVADGRPVFFRQNRVGHDGRLFSCLKFRTMVRDADVQLQSLLAKSPACRREWAATQKLRSDPRIHWIGRLLRKSSLDELPQFFNVLKGDMSVVGPRPIVKDEIARYGSHYRHYVAVRPGITGLWQVSGRNSLSYQERVGLDVQYVENISMTSDMKIIFRTVGIVAGGSGDH